MWWLALRLLKYFKQRFEMKSSRLETRPTQFAGGFVYYVCNLIFSRQDGLSLHPRDPHQLSPPPTTHPPIQSPQAGFIIFPWLSVFFWGGCFYSWIIIRLGKLFDWIFPRISVENLAGNLSFRKGDFKRFTIYLFNFKQFVILQHLEKMKIFLNRQIFF